MPSQTEFINFLAETIRADSDLAAFCQAKFSKDITVYVNSDDHIEPEEDNCPLIIVRAGGRLISDSGNSKQRQVKISAAIKDEAKPVTTDTITYYPGFETLDAFADILEKIIFFARFSPDNYITTPIQGPEDMCEFPFFKCFLGLQLQFDSNF